MAETAKLNFLLLHHHTLGEISTPVHNEIKKSSPTITLYPNPATGYIQLQFSNNDHAFSQAKISDQFGRCCKISPLVNQGNTIDMQDLPAGIYFIQIEGPNGKMPVQKIIKI